MSKESVSSPFSVSEEGSGRAGRDTGGQAENSNVCPLPVSLTKAFLATASHQLFLPSSWPRKSWSLGEWTDWDFCLWYCWLCWCWGCLLTGLSSWARCHSRFNGRIQHRVKGSTSLPKCDNVLLSMLDARWFLISVEHVPKGVWRLIHPLVGLQHPILSRAFVQIFRGSLYVDRSSH